MTSPPIQWLLWLDLETTGLDEREHCILEVGWGLTDMNLEWYTPPQSRYAKVEVVVNDTQTGVIYGNRTIWLDDYVCNMHVISNLLMDLREPAGMDVDEIEGMILGDIASVASDEDRITLAGSGVAQFDHRWLRHHMPLLHKRLTYYSFDTSDYERVKSTLMDGRMRATRGSAAHRALPDILYARDQAVAERTLLLDFFS